MEKKYCSYELAQLAKAAGFDEECKFFFDFLCKEIPITTYLNNSNSEIGDEECTAPELTHLQQWVYEKFKVWVETRFMSDFNSFIVDIREKNKECVPIIKDFDCPYKALESGLIEFLTTKKNAK